jgi:predicted transcriptional regulator
LCFLPEGGFFSSVFALHPRWRIRSYVGQNLLVPVSGYPNCAILFAKDGGISSLLESAWSKEILVSSFHIVPNLKYRSSMEIIDSILRSIGSGQTKTRLMYSAYLSYSQVKEYIGLLEKRNLIRLDPAMQLYVITEKGLKFLNAYQEIHELIVGTEEENEIPKPSSEVMAFNY